MIGSYLIECLRKSHLYADIYANIKGQSQIADQSQIFNIIQKLGAIIFEEKPLAQHYNISKHASIPNVIQLQNKSVGILLYVNHISQTDSFNTSQYWEKSLKKFPKTDFRFFSCLSALRIWR